MTKIRLATHVGEGDGWPQMMRGRKLHADYLLQHGEHAVECAVSANAGEKDTTVKYAG